MPCKNETIALHTPRNKKSFILIPNQFVFADGENNIPINVLRINE